jgi:hypothetical protein
MTEPPPPILYYPNFSPRSLPGIKRCLLLADEVAVVAPYSTPYMQAVLADTNDEVAQQIDRAGALGELWDLRPDSGGPVALRMLIDSDIATGRTQEFLAALHEGVVDPEIRTWAQARTVGAASERAWYVAPQFCGGSLPVGVEPFGIVEETVHGMPLLKLPFVVGMSIGLSEALWAAVDHGYTLFTDDPASEEFLMLRLRRGWQRLATDPRLRDQLGVERSLGSSFAGARLSAWTLRLKAPSAWERAATMDVPALLELREASDDAEALAAFRAGVASLAEDAELWQAANFQKFKARAEAVVAKEIEPAWAILEHERKTSVRDVFHAFDEADAMSTTVRGVPDLFLRAPAASGGAGAALGLASVNHLPSALLALACGIAATTVGDLMRDVRSRRADRRAAQYLSYVHRLSQSA